MSAPPSTEAPVYLKVAQNDGAATQRFMILCDEGWRLSIVCAGMYGWAADWLLPILGRRPYSAALSS